MSNKSSELVFRFVYAAPLLGLGLWAFIVGGGWWGAFLATLALGMSAEVIYRFITCRYKAPGSSFHCYLLFQSALLGFTTMYSLRDTKQGTALLFLGALMVIFFDTFSLLCGWAFGRHKIAPVASPNKTWEGFIGGTLLSFGAGLVTLMLLEEHYVEIGINGFVMGALMLGLPVIAFFGDLNESIAKRRLYKVVDNYRQMSSSNYVALKDFSNLLGPHGGISDRFDAMAAVFSTVGLAWLLLI